MVEQFGQMTEDERKVRDLGSMPIGDSTLLLFNRPSKKTLPLLKQIRSVSLVVSVQGKPEKPEEVKKLCEDNDVKHFWMQLAGANETLLAFEEEDGLGLTTLRSEVQQVIDKVTENKEVVVVHCAAGIHRTGIIGYTLLRVLGDLGEKEAYEALGKMRKETYNGVEDWRIKIAEKDLVQFFLQK